LPAHRDAYTRELLAAVPRRKERDAQSAHRQGIPLLFGQRDIHGLFIPRDRPHSCETEAGTPHRHEMISII
jgi:hypothetical protein